MKISNALSASIFFVLLNYNIIYAIEPSLIKGTVYSSYNNAVINGAIISTTTGIATKTSAGAFFLRVPPNLYDIYVSAPGYSSNLLTGIHAAPGQTAIVDLRITPSSTETAYLEGRIFNFSSKKPINRAFIATDIGGLATSDENGAFQMLTPSGFSDISVAAPGFTSKTIRNIMISPDSNNNIVVYLHKAPVSNVTVSGVLKNRCSGLIINDARVVSQTGQSSLTDIANYSVNTAIGFTSLIASAPDYQFSFKNITLYPFPESARIDIELLPSKNGFGLIRGVITDFITQEPVGEVKLVTDTGAISYSKHDGTYEVYTSYCTSSMTAQKQGFATMKIELFVNQGFPTTANLPLEPLGNISGKVFDSSDNHTISGAVIILEEQSGISTTSQNDGSYLIENILPGTYIVEAAQRCYITDNHSTDVVSGETVNLNFILDPFSSGNIQGFVSDIITGKTIPDASIITDHGAETTTDSTGFYSITLPACQTLITVEAKGYLTKKNLPVTVDENENPDFNVDLIPCPFSVSIKSPEMAGPDDISLSIFRAFRDEVLKNNTTLQEYTRSFYENAQEISEILINNPVLEDEFRDILLKAIVILENKKMAHSAEFLEESRLFLVQFSRKIHTSELKTDVNRLLLDLTDPDFFSLEIPEGINANRQKDR